MSNTPPNGLDLALIAPGKAAMYNPNLWRHMTSNRVAGMFATAFRDRLDGTLWLGYLHDGDFVGCQLMHVLCEGRHARTACFVDLAPRLDPVPNFWDGYQRLGRCFIDPAHQKYFIDPRWRAEGDQRTCLWCGHTQHLHRWSETVQRHSWRPDAAAAAASA